MREKQKKLRDRSAIIADIASIRHSVAGKLSETRRELKSGGNRTYYKLQRKVNGRNLTTYIPPSRVDAVRRGIEGHKRLRELLAELSAADTAQALAVAAEDAAKKKRRK